MSDVILSMENITKVYPNGYVANKNVNLVCHEKTIHALLGENGAGKTTLMKILFGFLQAESGKIYLRGKEIAFKDPLDAIKNGVGMVHQHFMLVDELSVAENLVLGEEPIKNGLFDMDKAVELTEEIAKKYNFDINPRALVGDCSVGVKQKIEILKALYRGADLLILDEPTAVLTPQETVELFAELKKLKNMGHTIIFISHKLNEVTELCDEFTVLRGGETIAVGKIKDYNEQQLSNLMVGREIELKIQKETADRKGEPVVEVKNLSYTNSSGKHLLNEVSFSLYKNHILGVAGVEGNGQTQLGELLTGLMKVNQGDVLINGLSIKNKSVREIRNLGVASISEDRMTYGCARNMTIEENLIADRYFRKPFSKGVMLSYKEMKKEAEKLIKEFSVDCPSPTSEAGVLSGGNMQKMIVAREFSSDSQVIIANQPTRGIDVGSSEFVRNQLVKISREKGAAVLLISADLAEVLEVSDSIIVLSNGEITAYFPDAKSVDETTIGEYMLGVKRMDKKEIARAVA